MRSFVRKDGVVIAKLRQPPYPLWLAGFDLTERDAQRLAAWLIEALHQMKKPSRRSHE